MELRTCTNNKHIMLNVENVDFKCKYDVVVVGGGTAGSVAAICSAKFGLKTLCVELNSFFGGLGTGIVMGYFRGENVGGFFSELDNEIVEESQTSYCNIKPWCEGIHHEAKKNIYEKKYMELGGKIMYHSIIEGVYTDNYRAMGVLVCTDGKSISVACDVIIDASGDSVITRLCDGQVNIGRSRDKKMQNFSSALLVKNSQNQVEHVYRDTGNINTENMTEYFEKLTKSYSELEKKGSYSSDDQNRIFSLCSLLGIREGVIAKGKDSLKLCNFLEGVDVKEPTFLMSGSFDKHLNDPGFEDDEVKDLLASKMRNNCVLNAPMPYGAMLPENIGGVINAGLCMDVSAGCRPISRLKKNCIKSGITAAVVARSGINSQKPLEECYEEVKLALQNEGLFADNKSFSNVVTERKNDYVEKMQSEQASVCGGAIYYAYKFVDESELLALVQNAQGVLRENLIIALSLKGNKMFASEIKELAKTFDSAIYILGKINDGEFDDLLFDLLDEKDFLRFSYAYDALSKRALINEDVEKRLNEYVLNSSFSRQIVFNGKAYNSVEDVTETIKELRKNKN